MKRLIPLFVVFCALLVLMLMREAGRPRSGAPGMGGKLRPVAAAPFTPEDVTAIEVAGPGAAGAQFALIREGARWTVDRPFRAPASTGDVGRLAGALAEASGELRTESADVATLERFDLTEDRAVTVVARGAGGAELCRVLVGRTSGRSGAFVRLVGEDGAADTRVYVVTADLRGMLGLAPSQVGMHAPERPEPAHFHDDVLPVLELATARGLEYVTPRHRVVFTKDAEGWLLTEGAAGIPVRPGSVGVLVRQLASAPQCMGLADPARGAVTGIASPTHRISVTLADGSVRTLLGAVSGAGAVTRRFVRLDVEQDPDVVYEVDLLTWRRIFPLADGLFELPRLPLQTLGLGRVVVRQGGALALDMSRDRGFERSAWVMATPRWPLPPAPQKLAGYPATLQGLRPVDYVDAGVAAFGEPDLVIRWGRDDASEEELATLEIGAPPPAADREFMARFPGGAPHLFVLTETMVDAVRVRPADLHDRRPLLNWQRAMLADVRMEVRGQEGFRTDWTLTPTDRMRTEWVIARPGIEEATPAPGAATWLDALLRFEVAGPAGPGDPDVRGGAEDEPSHRLHLRDHRDNEITLAFTPERDGKRVLVLEAMRFATSARALTPAADELE